jgi:hypothetical protein
LWTNHTIIFTTILENPLPFFVHLGSGNDVTGDGTWEKPFRSIQRALKAMNSATYNLCMVAGTNLAQTTITITNTIGQKGTPIEIRGWTNRARPRLKGTMNVLFDFNATTSNIIISGLELTNADYAFRINGTAAKIRRLTIRSNLIQGCSLGINALNASEISVIGNTCKRINYEGILLNNVSHYVVRGNRILNGNATGLRITGTSAPAEDVMYNICAWNNGIGLHNDSSGHAVIRNNVAFGNSGPGMDLWAGNHRLANNILMSNKGNGIQGGVSTNNYNLSFGNLTAWGGIPAQAGCLTVDPLLLSLNPASTQFMKIDLSSPCIDAGDPTLDYKPERRGAHLDIGAYEHPRMDLVPAAPSLIQATATGISSLSIVWKDNATNENGYRIFWSATNSKPMFANKTNSANTTNFLITGLTLSTRYYIWVEAFNAAGPSGTLTANAETLGYPKVKTVRVSPNPTSSRPAGGLSIRITFNETMDTSTPPLVYFDPEGPTGNQLCTTGGTWESNRIYTVKNSQTIDAATGDGWARIRVSEARNISFITQIPSTNFLFKIDTLPPVIHGFTVNGGAEMTMNPLVSITVDSNDGTGTSVIRWALSDHSTPPALSSSNWKPTLPATFQLGESGSSKVYLWAMDEASNISPAYSCNIRYVSHSTPEFENIRPSFNPIRRDQNITLAYWADTRIEKAEFILFTVTGEQVWKSPPLAVRNAPLSRDGTKKLVEYNWPVSSRETLGAGTYILGMRLDGRIIKNFTKVTVSK